VNSHHHHSGMALSNSILRLNNVCMVILTHPLLYQVSRSGRCKRDVAISDGYHENKWGTASWRIMADSNKSKQWAGLHVTPGRKDDQSALRSEMGGGIRYDSGNRTHMQVFPHIQWISILWK
jgi:hypothetical protein